MSDGMTLVGCKEMGDSDSKQTLIKSLHMILDFIDYNR